MQTLLTQSPVYLNSVKLHIALQQTARGTPTIVDFYVIRFLFEMTAQAITQVFGTTAVFLLRQEMVAKTYTAVSELLRMNM